MNSSLQPTRKPAAQDRRTATRVTYLSEVRYDGVETGAANVRISDISTTGAFIDSLANFPVGAILNLRFSVRAQELCVTSEVRHSLPRIGMGVRFVSIAPSDAAVLKDFVDEKAAA